MLVWATHLLDDWEMGNGRPAASKGVKEAKDIHTPKAIFEYCIAYIIRLGTIPLFQLRIP